MHFDEKGNRCGLQRADTKDRLVIANLFDLALMIRWTRRLRLGDLVKSIVQSSHSKSAPAIKVHEGRGSTVSHPFLYGQSVPQSKHFSSQQ